MSEHVSPAPDVETVVPQPETGEAAAAAEAEPAAPAESAVPPADSAEAETPPAKETGAKEPDAPQAAQEDVQNRLQALTLRPAEAELRAAAAMAGVSAAKLPWVVRLCDAQALCIQDADMGELAAQQVAAVLRDVPELAGSRSMPGSLGDHRTVGTIQRSEEDLVRETFSAHL